MCMMWRSMAGSVSWGGGGGWPGVYDVAVDGLECKLVWWWMAWCV